MVQKLQTNISTNSSKYIFYQEFIEWSNLLIRHFPEKKYQIIKTFFDEYSACVDSFFVDTIAFRSLKGIEDDEPEVAARQILRAFGDLAESRYGSYLQVMYKMFEICELTEDEADQMTPGKMASTLLELLREYYPKYRNLIDIYIITVRNANVHGNIRFDYQTEQITIFNMTPYGKEAFHRACLDIILSDFTNWKGQVHQLIEKASQEAGVVIPEKVN